MNRHPFPLAPTRDSASSNLTTEQRHKQHLELSYIRSGCRVVISRHGDFECSFDRNLTGNLIDEIGGGVETSTVKAMTY